MDLSNLNEFMELGGCESDSWLKAVLFSNKKGDERPFTIQFARLHGPKAQTTNKLSK